MILSADGDFAFRLSSSLAYGTEAGIDGNGELKKSLFVNAESNIEGKGSNIVGIAGMAGIGAKGFIIWKGG